jgi:acyl dehydratase
LKLGDELPVLEVPITATLVVAGALASRDFQDVHHDAEVAKASGAKDIFMNILTTQGHVGRYVTDWAGPRARITEMKLRLGVPMYPHDTLRLTGRVAKAHGDDVEVEVKGSNALGDHVTATVSLVMP